MFNPSYIRKVQQSFAEGLPRISIGGLHGSARAAFFLEIQKTLKTPLCVLTPHQEAAETIQKDLLFFIQWQREKKSLYSFPNWEILPYEPLSPFQEIVGERLAALNALMEGKADILVAPISAAMQKVMPKRILREFSFTLQAGEKVEMELALEFLTQGGYQQADQVELRGEFSLRGGILDVFPPDAALPARLEFFGDQIETIRRFDPDSQRSVGKMERVVFLPTSELVMNKKILEEGCLKMAASIDFPSDRKRVQEIVEKFKNIFPFPSAEIHAPYFYPDMETLFDYLPRETVFILEEPEEMRHKAKAFEESVHEGYLGAVARGDFPPLEKTRYLSLAELESALHAFKGMEHRLINLGDGDESSRMDIPVKSVGPYKNRFKDFVAQLQSWRGMGFQQTIVAPTSGQTRRIQELLVENETDCPAVVGDISTGFVIPESRFALIAEHEIFGVQHIHRGPQGKGRGRRMFKGFHDLKPGDLVVHLDYGVGEFVGVKTMDGQEESPEFLELLYAEGEKLYLPMDRLDLIQKYSGAEKSAVALDKLGGAVWKKSKARIKRAVMEMAQDLLKLYASRELVKGWAYGPDTFMHREFEDSFLYTETPDQAKAIQEVKKDLEKSRPMDRLICGDVGYGKTEVAMRAAFKVVADGKQVALLAPTTILTQQHLQTFQERFRSYPVSVGLVNRFRSPKEQKETILKVSKGEIQVLIGTHRLLQKDICFKDLGLLIIDEEQRFGVKHKEKLKEMRKQVDVLTLTATPIPRTLHFSMMGLRDLSVIETPPRDRLAIKTYARKFNPGVIKEAINRELARDGQIFFVHNRVESIYKMQDYIQRLLPHARVDVAHGQMKEHGLEDVMMRFLEKKIDVLVCTTIIESGLDIPSVNTIIINQAEKFGLAQLYQLRGRVGRYKHQAYAYLLVPDELVLKSDARKRIRAIMEMSDLGAGFHLATRDLEIRGTGSLLGHQQSGQIAAIGYEMYVRLLEDTVKELKGVRVEETIDPDLSLDYKGAIPRNYIPVLIQRLEMYRRLYTARDIQQLSELINEIRDRYGPLPLVVKKVLAVLELKVLARGAWVSEIKQRGEQLHIRFHPNISCDPQKLVALAGKMEGRLKILPDNRLAYQTEGTAWDLQSRDLKKLLKELKEMVEASPKGVLQGAH